MLPGNQGEEGCAREASGMLRTSVASVYCNAIYDCTEGVPLHCFAISLVFNVVMKEMRLTELTQSECRVIGCLL